MPIPLPFLQWGTVLWANGLPAKDVQVRLFDRDTASSDDDLTTSAGVSSETGRFEVWCDRARAVDTVPSTADIPVWDPGDPFARPPRPPSWKTVSVTVQTPDPNDSYDPYLEFRYTLFGQARRFTANVQFGQTVYRLPDVGIGFRQNFCGVGNGAGNRLALVTLQERSSQNPRIWYQIQAADDVHGMWKSIDGAISSATSIAVGTNADNRLEIFVRGSDGTMLHCWQSQASDASPFGAWSSMGGQWPQSGPIAVGRNADGTLEVFALGVDGAVHHNRQQGPNGTWGGWSSLGGSVPAGGDVIVATNQDGRLELFAHGHDGAINHAWQQSVNTNWSGWSALAGGTLVTGPLAVGRNQDGRLEVFAQGLDGAIWHTWQQAPNSGWGGWFSLGGRWIGLGLSVASNPDGRLELFAHGMDRNLYHAWQEAPNSGWASWSSLGLWSSPNAAVPQTGYRAIVGNWSTGKLMVFQATQISNQPVATRGQWSGGWTNWSLLQMLEPPPAVVSRPSTPTLNSVTPGDGLLDVSWTSVSGATGYQIGYGTEQNGAYAGQATVGGVTTARIEPLSNGTTYYVAVRATNSAGESSYSNQISGRPDGARSGIADLVLEQFSATPQSPSVHQAFNVNFTLKNNGTKNTGPFSLRIMRDQLSPTNASISIVNFPSLSPGQSMAGSIYEGGFSDGGSHTWEFYVGALYIGVGALIIY